jgi:hypothetical protein
MIAASCEGMPRSVVMDPETKKRPTRLEFDAALAQLRA